MSPPRPLTEAPPRHPAGSRRQRQRAEPQEQELLEGRSKSAGGRALEFGLRWEGPRASPGHHPQASTVLHGGQVMLVFALFSGRTCMRWRKLILSSYVHHLWNIKDSFHLYCCILPWSLKLYISFSIHLVNKLSLHLTDRETQTTHEHYRPSTARSRTPAEPTPPTAWNAPRTAGPPPTPTPSPARISRGRGAQITRGGGTDALISTRVTLQSSDNLQGWGLWWRSFQEHGKCFVIGWCLDFGEILFSP